MGFKVTLTVRHIRGNSFTIDCARDADTLGIKVLIWESQKIPIENQRIIFAGREMNDSTTLSDLNIVDGSTIFLVEIGVNDTTESAVVSAAKQPLVINNEMEVSVDNHEYSHLDAEEYAAEARIKQVVELSRWIRMYLMLGLWVSFFFFVRSVFVCAIGSLTMAVVLVIYAIGFIACRRLQRCLMIVPALLVGMIGFFGLLLSVYMWASGYVHGKQTYWMIVPVVITFMHIVIFACICRLMTKVGQLSAVEFRQARRRIQKRCCLC